MGNRNRLLTEEKTRDQNDAGTGKMKFLVLHNDDYHTFDYVISSLVEVCEHDPFQAEQCTYLVHYKGSCDVLKGEFSQLVPYRKGLASRDLKVTIE